MVKFEQSIQIKCALILCITTSVGFIGCNTVSTKSETAAVQTPAVEIATVLPAKRSPANHSWGGYHWARTTQQFTLKIGDNLTTTSWKSLLSQTSQDWNSPGLVGESNTPVLLALVAGRSTSRRCSMVAGTTQVCNSKYGNNGWLGLASINIVNGEHITQGTAKMNDTYFTMSKYNNVNEKLHVVCQEIAHTFGLDHQSEDGTSQNSCMDYFSNTGANATSTLSTKPNAHDFQQLNSIYSHLDTTTTVSPYTSASSATDSSEEPTSWGQHLPHKSKGQSAFYEKRNNDGSITITHVYWIPELTKNCRDCDHRNDAERLRDGRN